MDSVKQLWVSGEVEVQNQGNGEEPPGNRQGDIMDPFLT